MKTVEEALAAIPDRRDALNQIDDRLSDVIRHVQRVLAALKVNVRVEITFQTEDGHFVLMWGKWNGQWQIGYGAESDEDMMLDVPLVNAPRHVRAQIFAVTPDQPLAPIERLVIAVVESLEGYARERSPLLDTAYRLAAVLEKAGFPNDGGK